MYYLPAGIPVAVSDPATNWQVLHPPHGCSACRPTGHTPRVPFRRYLAIANFQPENLTLSSYAVNATCLQTGERCHALAQPLRARLVSIGRNWTRIASAGASLPCPMASPEWGRCSALVTTPPKTLLNSFVNSSDAVRGLLQSRARCRLNCPCILRR
jgi:hypothetical protein